MALQALAMFKGKYSLLADQADSIAAMDFSTALAASSLAALAGWLILAALCRSLWRNKCSNLPHYRV